MKKFIFGAIGLALCALALNAAGPPDLARRTAQRSAIEALNTDGDDVQDVIYVGQPHPVMLRLRLRVDRKSALTHWGERLEKLFAQLDHNDNKWLDRNEVAKAPSATQLLMYFQGNLYAISTGRAGQQPSVGIADFDTDRDGKVTLAEFKDYYRRNNAGPIAMQAQVMASYYNPNSVEQSQSDAVFEKLDTNKDGKLSKAELDAAEKTLMRSDRDDNELVSQQELGLGAQTAYTRRLVQQVGQPQRPVTPQSNLILVERDSGKRMTNKFVAARELIKRFDKDKDDALSREEAGFSKTVFDSIDRNDNGELSALELARWIGGKPAGEFTVRLVDQGAMMGRGGLMGAGKGGLDDMSVNLEGVRINVVVQPGYGVANDRYFTQLFEQLAADNKNFVTRKQLEGNRGTAFYLRSLFDLGDRDNDGKLTEKEFKGALAVLTSMRGAQVNLSIYSTGNGLFQVLDANSDGQLSLREMRSAWKRLGALDRDKDSSISRTEFPQQFQLSVSQGPSYGSQIRFTNQPTTGGAGRPVAAARGPLWFRKMDRNGDGDVSRTEWLGEKDAFDAADADKDGLISADEAEAYDARVRAKTG